MTRKIKSTIAPAHYEIAALAAEIYQREGCIPGRDLDNWLRAEATLQVQPATPRPSEAPARMGRARTR